MEYYAERKKNIVDLCATEVGSSPGTLSVRKINYEISHVCIL